MRSNKTIFISFLKIFFLSLLFFSCKSKSELNKIKNEPPDKNEKSVTPSPGSALAWYDLEDENVQVVNLPDELSEISGITMTGDGRLFCTGDEDADIFEFDRKTGDVIKKFYVGNSLLGTSKEGDFEDIVFVKDRFYLLHSKGSLIEFTEGKDREHVAFKTYDTKLTKSYDVEGLCFDPETNSLLLACKEDPGEGHEKSKAVYSFSLSSMTLTDTPRFLVPLSKIKENTVENEFGPSGIARHPVTGTFFIIAARGNVIVELSKKGELMNEKDLPKKIHKQPEGITFDKENNLIISNEGKEKTAAIIVYPMNK